MSMKTSLHLLAMAAILSVGTLGAGADDKHAHKPTPKGGRLLDKTEPHAELVVEKNRTVSIHFYNADMKPVAATTQQVTVIANAKSGKTTLEFEKKGESLVSKSPLPEGEGYNVVVQFRQTADAKPVNLRFKLDLHTCGECKRAEYACTCHH
jgi:hypothetical protein